jgi:uncharacterized protein (TIGR03435 family)
MMLPSVLAIALLVPGFAQNAPGPLTFEVASIKPASPDAQGFSIQLVPGGGLNMTNVPVRTMIALAYGVRDYQVTGCPGWAETGKFDIKARPERTAVNGQEDLAKMTEDQMKTVRDQSNERLRGLLAERFGLVVHKETKEQPIYALVLAKNGPKLKEVQEAGARPGLRMERGRLQGMAAPMDIFAMSLSNAMGRPVVDKTGLLGKYDFVLEWTPDVGAGGNSQGFGDGITSPGPAPGGPTIFTATQEQLGLRLDSQKGPVPNIVIDRVEKPSEN